MKVPFALRTRVTFRKHGRDVWSRVVIAESDRQALAKAMELADWFGIDIAGCSTRIRVEEHESLG